MSFSCFILFIIGKKVKSYLMTDNNQALKVSSREGVFAEIFFLGGVAVKTPEWHYS